MASLISIKLSAKDKTYTVKRNEAPIGAKPIIVEDEENLRELEVQILTVLFNIAGALTKKPGTLYRCGKIVNEIEALEGDNVFFKLTEDDMKNLKKGFEGCVGLEKRPTGWSNAVDLWSQIANPTEVVVS